MSKNAPPNPWLPPQQEALPRYLAALLRETWEAPAETFLPVDFVPPEGEVEPVSETSNPLPVTDPAIPEARLRASDILVPAEVSAAAPFDVQLFQVAGLTLALPLSALVGIVDSTDLVTAGAECPRWLRGRLCYPHGEIQVVDTAHWVMPPGAPGSPVGDRYPVLMIAEGRWGLACDGVGAVVTLDPAGVRWRSSRTQRRWLAGMVSQPSCALLDAVQLAVLFDEALATSPRSGSV